MTVSGWGVDPSASRAHNSIYRGEIVPVKAILAAGHAQALWHLLGPEARRCLKSEATGGSLEAWRIGSQDLDIVVSNHM